MSAIIDTLNAAYKVPETRLSKQFRNVPILT